MSDTNELYKKKYYQKDLDKFVKGFTGQEPNYPKPPGEYGGGTGADYDIMANGITKRNNVNPEQIPDWESSLAKYLKNNKTDFSGGDGRKKWLTDLPPEVVKILRGPHSADKGKAFKYIGNYLDAVKAPDEMYGDWNKYDSLSEKEFQSTYGKKKDDYVPLQSNKPKAEPKAPVKDFWDGYDGDGNDKEDKADQITEQRNKPMVDYNKAPNDKINATSRLKDLGLHGGVNGFSPELMKAAADPRITDEMLRDLFKKTHKQAVLD